MSNWCSFKIVSSSKKKINLSKFKNYFSYCDEDSKNEKFIPRTSIYKISKIIKKDDNYIRILEGDCAWSCKACMLDIDFLCYNVSKKDEWQNIISLNEICKECSVEAEVFSDEYGIGFMEHYYVNSEGKLLVNEHCSGDNPDDFYGGSHYSFKRVIDIYENTIDVIKNDYLQYFRLNEEEKRDRQNVIALFSEYWEENNYFCDNVFHKNKVVTREELASFFNVESLNDKDYIKALIKGRNEVLLKKISSNDLSLMSDIVFIKECILDNGYFIVRFLKSEIRENKEIINFIYKFLENRKYRENDIDEFLESYYINNELEILGDNLIKELILMNGGNIEFASDSIKRDKTFLLDLLNNNKISRFSLKDVSEELRDDKEFVMNCVTRFYCLDDVSERLKNDEEILIESLKRSIYSMRYIGDELKNNKNFILKLIDEFDSIKYIAQYMGDNLKDDKDVVLKAMKKDYRVFIYASDRLKKDETICDIVDENHDLEWELTFDEDLDFF